MSDPRTRGTPIHEGERHACGVMVPYGGGLFHECPTDSLPPPPEEPDEEAGTGTHCPACDWLVPPYGEGDICPGVLDSLGAAWDAAEAALPDGWVVYRLEKTAMMDQRWQAEAQRRVGPVVAWNRTRTVLAEGPTPAAALRALAARLRER